MERANSAAGFRCHGRGNCGARAFVQGTWRPSPRVDAWKAASASSAPPSRNRATPSASALSPTPSHASSRHGRPAKDDQLRLRAEREVGQLNFQDFRLGGEPQLGPAEHGQLRTRARQDMGLRDLPTRSASGKAPLRFSPIATKTSRTWWTSLPARRDGRHGQ